MELHDMPEQLKADAIAARKALFQFQESVKRYYKETGKEPLGKGFWRYIYAIRVDFGWTVSWLPVNHDRSEKEE